MTTICRILPHDRGDGPSNMAMDEALLDSVADDPTMAVVRTYEWSMPTLSLGYFQKMEEVAADPRWASVPIVRRPTGGGALWHDREVTYAVVVPSAHPASRPSRSLYRNVPRGDRRTAPIPRHPCRPSGASSNRTDVPGRSPVFMLYGPRRAGYCFSEREARRERPATTIRRGPPARLAPARPFAGRPRNFPVWPTFRRSSRRNSNWAEVLR